MTSYPFLSYQPVSSYVPPSFEDPLQYDVDPRQKQKLEQSFGIEMSEKPFHAKKSLKVERTPENEESVPLNKIQLMAEKLERPSESMAFLEMYHKSAVKVEQASSKLKKASVSIGLISAFIFICSTFSFFGEYLKQSPKPRLASGMTDFSNYSETETFVDNLVQSQ